MERWVWIAAAALLAVSASLRVWRLGSLPGINGDEGWLGAQVAQWTRGDPFAWRTPSGNFINPFFLGSEALLLLAFEPAFALLRLPSALAAAAGLACAAAMARRLWGRFEDGLLLAVVMACLPLHVMYSRLGWDPSFVFLTAPFVLFPAMRVADAGARGRDAAWLAAGAFFSVWVHLSSLVFVGLTLSSVAIVRAPGAFRSARARLRGGPALLAASLLVVGVAVVSLIAAPAPTPALDRAAQLGDVLSGQRGAGYLAAMPPSAATRGLGAACLAVFAIASVGLLIRPRARQADRFLGVMGLGSLAIALGGFDAIFELSTWGCERYVLWLLPLFATTLTRSARLWSEGRGPWARRAGTAALLATAAGGLLFTWTRYFVPSAAQTFAATLHPTFRTGPREPKAAAAAAIRDLARSGPGPAVVVAEDWWLEHPLRYLLEPDFAVHPAGHPGRIHARQFILVGWTGGAFVQVARERFAARGYSVETRDVPGVDGHPVLTLLVATAPRASSAPRDSSRALPSIACRPGAQVPASTAVTSLRSEPVERMISFSASTARKKPRPPRASARHSIPDASGRGNGVRSGGDPSKPYRTTLISFDSSLVGRGG